MNGDAMETVKTNLAPHLTIEADYHDGIVSQWHHHYPPPCFHYQSGLVLLRIIHVPSLGNHPLVAQRRTGNTTSTPTTATSPMQYIDVIRYSLLGMSTVCETDGDDDRLNDVVLVLVSLNTLVIEYRWRTMPFELFDGSRVASWRTGHKHKH